MRRALSRAALMAVLSIGGLLAFGITPARAQGFGLSVGTGYGGYGYSSYGTSISGYGHPGSFYSGYGYYGGAVPIYSYSVGYGYVPSPYGASSWYGNGFNGYGLNAYPSSPYGYQGYGYGPRFMTGGFGPSTPNRFLPW